MKSTIREILNQDMDASIRLPEEAITLPPRCYTEPQFYEFEKDAIFYKEWLCIGRLEQIPKPGDYFSLTVIDEPLIAVRSSESEVKVMSAVCRHRGMIVTAPGNVDEKNWRDDPPDTSGHCEHFRCPYHYWTYDLEGKLVLAPEMDRTPGFNHEEIRLPQFPTEIWNGFLFTNFDRNAPPLKPRLKTLTDLLENWHFEEMVDVEPLYLPKMPWNWKVMHENSIEAYHADRLHAGLHSVLPSAGVLPTMCDEDEATIIVRLKATSRDYSLNPTFRPLLPVIDTLTGEQREVTIYSLIPPSLLVGVNTDSAIYRIVLPEGPQSINIRFGILLPRKSLRPAKRVQEIRKMAAAGTGALSNQDFPTDAAVQKGLRSRFAPRSRYSWQEESLTYFNRWLVNRYKAALAE